MKANEVEVDPLLVKGWRWAVVVHGYTDTRAGTGGAPYGYGMYPNPTHKLVATATSRAAAEQILADLERARDAAMGEAIARHGPTGSRDLFPLYSILRRGKGCCGVCGGDPTDQRHRQGGCSLEYRA